MKSKGSRIVLDDDAQRDRVGGYEARTQTPVILGILSPRFLEGARPRALWGGGGNPKNSRGLSHLWISACGDTT